MCKPAHETSQIAIEVIALPTNGPDGVYQLRARFSVGDASLRIVITPAMRHPIPEATNAAAAAPLGNSEVS